MRRLNASSENRVTVSLSARDTRALIGSRVHIRAVAKRLITGGASNDFHESGQTV
jgi:hypothetical protein